MKLYIGVGSEVGLVHSSVTTPANKHDITQIQHLLNGEEDTLCGYTGVNKREELQGRELAINRG